MLGKKKSRKTVLFLCTGDTCRGPMAQGYMKEVLNQKGIKNIEVRTAGVMTIAGLIPTPEASQVMKNAEVDIANHRSTPLTPELIRRSDLILGMTPFHVQFAVRMAEDAKGKTYLLKEFAASDMKNYQITDPMGATLEVYKRVYREMKLAIDKMIEQKEFFTGVEEGKSAAPAQASTPAAKRAAAKKKADGAAAKAAKTAKAKPAPAKAKAPAPKSAAAPAPKSAPAPAKKPTPPPPKKKSSGK
jgi:protein-tyrosine phosphatase